MNYLLHHLLADASQRAPEKPAVADGHVSLTYAGLARTAGYVAARLREQGLASGDRVAFFLDHDVEQAAAVFGIAAAGGVFVPIGMTLFPQQVAHIVGDSEARVLITTAERRDGLGEALEGCRALEAVWTVDELQDEADLPTDSPAIGSGLAALLYTSGSTGRPKGVMFSHRNLLAGSRIVSEYLELSDEDRLLGALPLSFDYGLNQLITMVDNTGYYRFLAFQFPREIVATLAAEGITGLAGVPPLWALLARASLAKAGLTKLRLITNSGGALPTKVLDGLRLGDAVRETAARRGL